MALTTPLIEKSILLHFNPGDDSKTAWRGGDSSEMVSKISRCRSKIGNLRSTGADGGSVDMSLMP